MKILSIFFIFLLRKVSTYPQAVIQYDQIETAHIPSPHLKKSLVILPKVSHGMQYLTSPLRREAASIGVKPSMENQLQPSPTLSTMADTQDLSKNIFNGLNLNYEIPSYSTPENFQDSVNALTHMLANKQIKLPTTSYPVSDTPEHVKQSTVNALVNVLIGMDKEKKQNEMLTQIVQFMHRKKLQQEQQSLIDQLQSQMQKDQYKPFLQNNEQVHGLISVMRKILEPLKHEYHQGQSSGSKVESSSASEDTFDWTPISRDSYVKFNHPTQGPQGPATAASNVYSTGQRSPTTYYSHSITSPESHENEGYVIKLDRPAVTRPTIMKDYVQSTGQNYKGSSHQYKTKSSDTSTFQPKYEHYVMKQHGQSSKPHLVKLQDSSHAASMKYLSKGMYEEEFGNNYHSHQRNHGEHGHSMDDSKIAFDFIAGDTEHEMPMHIHAPYSDFSNHEFDQEFLKDFDHMHYKEDKDHHKDRKKSTQTSSSSQVKGPQKMVLLKVTRQ